MFGIGNPVHRCLQTVRLEDELDVVIVREELLLILIVRRALDEIWLCSASARNQVDDIIFLVALVIVYVSGAHNNPGMQAGRQPAKEIAQRNFVRPRIVTDFEMRLNVSHRRMMEANQNVIDRWRKIFELLRYPAVLVRTGHQLRVAV